MAKTRLKSKAAAYAAQSRDEVAADIRTIGDLQRDMGREAAAMNDAIADITAQHQPRIDAIKARLDVLQQGVKTWCEANRNDLTENGKTKTANFITGTVQWRNDPPSVTVRNQDQVIKMLGALGLTGYVRVRKELNKEAVLADRAAAEGKESPEKDAAAQRLKLLAGLTITIKSGVEQFVITPVEVETA